MELYIGAARTTVILRCAHFLARLEGWLQAPSPVIILRGSPKRLAPQDDDKDVSKKKARVKRASK
jgi:hypothetical protein